MLKGDCYKKPGKVKNKSSKCDPVLEQITATLNNSEALAYLVDFETRFIEVNDRFCQETGYDRHDFLQMRSINLRPEHMHDKVRNFVERLRRERHCTTDSVCLRKDGSCIAVELSATVMQCAAKPLIMVMLRDLGGQKQGRQDIPEYADLPGTFLNDSQTNVCYKDGKGRWIYANKAMLYFYGLEHVDYVGKTDREIALHSDLYQQVLSFVEKTAQTVWQKRERETFTLALSVGDDKTLSREVVMIPRFHEDGSPREMTIIGRDVTEAVMAAEALKEKNRKVRRTNMVLQGLLEQERDKYRAQERQIQSTLNRFVFPYLDNLASLEMEDKGKEYIQIVNSHLKSLAESFTRRLDDPGTGLTPKELLVADLVRQGKKSSEIGRLLGLKVRTVEVYRTAIRKKLKLQGRRTNLQRYLQKKFPV